MRFRPLPSLLLMALALMAASATWLMPDTAAGQVCNVKVVTDASPDYYDLPSMVHSITGRWSTPEEKCWAMFYWNHIARRQTSPMILHGLELTDPIRQFNDYGYTMCSTIAGVNCGIWHQMGLPVKFWDISLHTVPECFYGDRWHMYDNSMSAIYTLCDGVTIAGVEDIGKEGACAASGGKTERGHIAKYHCLNATSPNGFLTGADTPRDLAQEYRCFNPSGLKHRWYYHNWDWGHRYVLNLREGETYTRYYRSLGKERKYFVPNRGKDPEAANTRYRIRGNGVWTFQPRLTPAEYQRFIHSATDVEAVSPAGLQPARAGTPATVVFKIQSANVTASQTIQAEFFRRSAGDAATIEISTNNGLTWTKVWQAAEDGPAAGAAGVDRRGQRGLRDSGPRYPASRVRRGRRPAERPENHHDNHAEQQDAAVAAAGAEHGLCGHWRSIRHGGLVAGIAERRVQTVRRPGTEHRRRWPSIRATSASCSPPSRAKKRSWCTSSIRPPT